MRSNPSCGKFDRKIILFMDTRFIKIPLAAASLAYAIQLFTVGQVGAGVGMVLVAALLVLITLQSMRLLFNEVLAEVKASPESVKQLLSVGESARNEKLDQNELAAWTMVTHLILNLSETVTKG